MSSGQNESDTRLPRRMPASQAATSATSSNPRRSGKTAIEGGWLSGRFVPVKTLIEGGATAGKGDDAGSFGRFDGRFWPFSISALYLLNGNKVPDLIISRAAHHIEQLRD